MNPHYKDVLDSRPVSGNWEVRYPKGYSILLRVFSNAVNIPVTEIYSVTDEDDIADMSSKFLKFVHISSRISDQILMFWKLREAKAFGESCYIVFTDINESLIWEDLTRIYQGTKFGSLFLMEYKSNAKPKPCPSQKGLYMK